MSVGHSVLSVGCLALVLLWGSAGEAQEPAPIEPAGQEVVTDDAPLIEEDSPHANLIASATLMTGLVANTAIYYGAIPGATFGEAVALGVTSLGGGLFATLGVAGVVGGLGLIYLAVDLLDGADDGLIGVIGAFFGAIIGVIGVVGLAGGVLISTTGPFLVPLALCGIDAGFGEVPASNTSIWLGTGLITLAGGLGATILPFTFSDDYLVNFSISTAVSGLVMSVAYSAIREPGAEEPLMVMTPALRF